MAEVENKFEALVGIVITDISAQGVTINIKELLTTNENGELTNTVPTRIKQTEDIIDYLILINFYNENLGLYKDANKQKKITIENIDMTAKIIARKTNEHTENYCRNISDFLGDTKTLEQAKDKKKYCLNESDNNSNISFKEIHDFVQQYNRDTNTGGKSKTNKIKKTKYNRRKSKARKSNKRKKTKARKTNKRNKTKSKINKRKKRTRRR
jgi:hypothetical protein